MTGLEDRIVWVPTLLLVTLRVAGIMLAAPVFGEAAVPAKLRVPISAAMALAVVGRLGAPVPLPSSWADLVLGAGGELVLGAAIGLAARVIFAGVELGAFHVAQQMGLSLAAVADPQSGGEGSAPGGLLRLVAIVVFLAIGGHRAMVGGLLRTFDAVPLLGFAPGEATLAVIVRLLGASFVLALKVAAPVLVAMLLATVALGLLQRTMPQCHALSIGLPVRAMLGLLVLAASLAVLGPLVEAAAEQVGRAATALATGGS